MQPSDEQMLSIFAHELREPLASILFAVQSMRETACAEHSCRELRSLIERQGTYLARMIDNVLEVYHGGSGKLRLHKEWFDLNAAMTIAVETARPQFSQQSHHLSLFLPSSPLYVFADAARVQQIVVNLLVNAAKYTASGGTIALSATAVNEGVIIVVRDNGHGLTEPLLPRVFDLYRRSNDSSQQRIRGLGIGLALVKSLVELHGGSVEAHSEGVGKGSTFIVQFPCAASGTPKGPNDVAPPPSGDRPDRLPSDGFMTDA